MAYRKRSFMKRRPKRTYKKRVTRKRAAPLRRLVRREVMRTAEKKTAEVYNLGRNLYTTPTAGWDSTNVIDMGFNAVALQVGQGTGQGQRIGNKIRVNRIIFKGTFVPAQYNATDNSSPGPIQVKLVLFYDKEFPTSTPAPKADFFQMGNTTLPLQNDLVDMWAPFNTDKYGIMATKTFKLGFSVNNVSVAPTLASQPNNDFPMNQNVVWDMTKYFPKVTTYNDNNTDATSRQLYMAVIYARADGSQAAASQLMMGLQYMLHATYTDM